MLRGVDVSRSDLDSFLSEFLWSSIDCQSLTPEWKRAASALKGIVKVGAVDAEAHKSLGQQFGVSGFPTIKIFGANKRSPTDYQGGRTADAIVEQALSQVKNIVNERLGKRGGSSGGGSGGGGGGSGKDAIELTDANFQVNVCHRNRHSRDLFQSLVPGTRLGRCVARWIQ